MAAALIAALCGCASRFGERHFFKSVDARGNTVNYYRLKIKGGTMVSSSRYLSGYFDEEAVNSYFSEMAQPDKGRFGFKERGDRGTTVEALDESLAGRKLVMLLSSNSDAVANQIGAFAENQQMTEALTRIALRDRLVAGQSAEAALTELAVRGKALQDLGENLVGTPGDDPEASLLAFVNALASDLGNTTPFESLDAAATWLTYNRGRLLGGVQ